MYKKKPSQDARAFRAFRVADNLGYSRVVLEETIADGASGCRVTVYLKPTQEVQAKPAREYFAG